MRERVFLLIVFLQQFLAARFSCCRLVQAVESFFFWLMAKVKAEHVPLPPLEFCRRACARFFCDCCQKTEARQKRTYAHQDMKMVHLVVPR